MVTISCMRCGHEDTVDGDGNAEAVRAAGVYQCSECNARMFRGTLMPRVVVSTEAPYFVTLSFDGAEPIRMDTQFAAIVAKNILSVALH